MVTSTKPTHSKQDGYTLLTVIIISVIILAILSIVLQYIAALATNSRNITQLIAAQNTAISGLIGTSTCEQQDTNTLPGLPWDITPNQPCVMDGTSSNTIGTNTLIVRKYAADTYATSSHVKADITQKLFKKTLNVLSEKQNDLLQPARKPTRIATSDTHSCVVAAGKIYCWGKNNHGQLGNGAQDPSGSFTNPVAVDMSSNASSLKGKVVTDIATGHHFTCALSGSEIHCWGKNNHGQLGNGTKNNSSRPVKINTLSSQNPIQAKSVSQLATAGNTACVVAASKVYCWGQLSWTHKGGTDDPYKVAMLQPSNTDEPTPIQVGHASWGELNSQPVSQIALTHKGICAIALKKLYCWGDVIKQDNFRITPEQGHKYRILSTFYIWGKDGGTRLIYTHLNDNLNDNGISSIVSGSNHLCAIDGKSDLICWGGNGLGQLGNNTMAGDNDAYYWQDPYTPMPDISKPQSYTSIPKQEYGVQQVASSGAGWFGLHTCAVTNKQNVYCWGSNLAGQIGNGRQGATEQVTSPYKVNLHGLPVEQVATSLTDTCAIAGGKVYCWGQIEKGYDPDNYNKDLFEVHTRYISALPSEINLAPLGVTPEDLKDYTKPANGYCTTSTARSVYCWGYDSTNNNKFGQLGDGTTINRRTAVSIQGKHSNPPIRSEAFTQVATGINHACALSGGKVYCWGINHQGQLGSGVLSPGVSLHPVAVDISGSSGLQNTLVTYIAAGKESTCAISEGRVYCWGKNNYRQTSGSNAGWSTLYKPVAVDMSSAQSSLRNKKVVQLAMGNEHSCALAGDNTIHCWGRNDSGQLGNGTNTNSATPVQVNTTNRSSSLHNKQIRSITAGYDHTCAITTDNVVSCWGKNNQGQLGNQNNANQNKPVLSGTGPTNWAPLKDKQFHSVAAAGDYTCAILTDNTTKPSFSGQPKTYTSCWGTNSHLQLLKTGMANTSTIQEGTDSHKSGYVGFSISAHPYGACLLVGRELPCWGGIAGITGKQGKIIYPNSASMENMKTISNEREIIAPKR